MNAPSQDLDYLAERLRGEARALQLDQDPGHQAPMTRALQRVRLAFGDSGKLAASPRSARAQLAFRSGQALRFIDLKYLCHAVNRPNAWDGRRLLEDPRLLQQLLDQVDTWQAEPRRFRQCYRGLLAAFGSAPASSGRERLGRYLRQHRDRVAHSLPALEWTRELLNHPDLKAEAT